MKVSRTSFHDRVHTRALRRGQPPATLPPRTRDSFARTFVSSLMLARAIGVQRVLARSAPRRVFVSVPSSTSSSSLLPRRLLTLGASPVLRTPQPASAAQSPSREPSLTPAGDWVTTETGVSFRDLHVGDGLSPRAGASSPHPPPSLEQLPVLGGAAIEAWSKIQETRWLMPSPFLATRAGDFVKVELEGRVVGSDEVFESTRRAGQARHFLHRVGTVVLGLDEAISTMRVGSRRLVRVPPFLGYGFKRVGPIPPNSVRPPRSKDGRRQRNETRKEEDGDEGGKG